MKPYYDRAVELLSQTPNASKLDIARQIKEEFNLEDGLSSIQRNIYNWDKDNPHKALAEYCEEFGIPVGQVGHYWYKGKHISIHAKTEGKKTYEDLRDEIILEMEQHVPE